MIKAFLANTFNLFFSSSTEQTRPVVSTAAPTPSAHEQLMMAAKAGDCNSIRKLVLQINGPKINQPDKDGNTALHHAIYSGHFNAVSLLIELGSDVRQPHGDKTPQQMAKEKGIEAITNKINDRLDPSQMSDKTTKLYFEILDSMNQNRASLKRQQEQRLQNTREGERLSL